VAQVLINALTVHVDFRRFDFSGYATNQMGREGRSPAGCDTLPMNDALEAQKETGNEEE
jgi:hypothetical protein